MSSESENQVIEEEKKESFLEKLKEIKKTDERVRFCLDLMKSALSQKEKADFKTFWDSKIMCLEIFKEDLSPYVREKLWNEYLEINNQAQTLKSLVEKEASYAREQIELAVKALEDQIKDLKKLANTSETIEFPKIEGNIEIFQDCQKELNVLSTLSSKLQSLRKEVIQTPIRYKDKNQFFKKLSDLGDIIYPRRKELIQEVSDAFSTDVSSFMEEFEKIKRKAKFYELREKIKNLQAAAKLLSLHVTVFTNTRSQLSTAWNEVKKMDDERRQGLSEKRGEFEKNQILVQEKIDELLKKRADETLDDEATLKQVKEILSFMKTVELAAKDVKDLKTSLMKIEDEIIGKKTEAEKKIKEEHLEKVQGLKNDLLALLKEETTEEKHNELKELSFSIKLSSFDNDLIKDLLATTKPLILSPDEKLLTACLTEVKKRIDYYRKLLGSSIQDFERAFIYQELLEKEKSVYSKIEDEIDNLDL